MAGYYDRDRNVRKTDGTYNVPGDATVAPIMNHPMTHHGNVAEYQASGIPFFQKVTCPQDDTVTVQFPFVTQWVQVIVQKDKKVAVSFQESALSHSGGNFNGTGSNDSALAGVNYVILDGSSETAGSSGMVWRMKTTQLCFLEESGTSIEVYIVAGLTGVPRDQFPDISSIIGVGATAVITTNDGTNP